ncbi:unnamed protein product [Pocillopora meandrina]|uniref:THAP-type domain-containing protein n=1 Tax=Pocillopora meandrina TaxID=46732 RepID=A0AAU9X1R4_9CNID|nr:unnamed protein product [Pocillopora meandrina]
MVKRCVVQFCTDSNKTGHTMQIFPNDANLKRQFVKFVQVKIADFVEPFERSVVCSSHFSSWCCTDDSGLTRSKLFEKNPSQPRLVLPLRNPAEKQQKNLILFTAQDSTATLKCLPRYPQHQRTSYL